MRPCNFFPTGSTDLAVVRNDGIIELYALVGDDEFELRASKKINEAITGVEAGSYKGFSDCEFIISTFSGRILLLRSSEVNQRKGSAVKDDKKLSKDQEAKIK